MPIVDVEIVERTQSLARPELTQALADALGDVFGAEPGRVWVRVRTLSGADYAENRQAAPKPVFVTVLQADPAEGAARQDLASRITAAVARLTGRSPDNVHVLFEPAGRGRVAFGGRLNI